MITDQELLDAIEQGVDNNLVVFDSNNPEGKLTIRLVRLMLDVALENNIDKPTHLFVGRHVVDFEDDRDGRRWGNCVVDGVEICPCDALNLGGLAHRHYEKLGGCYSHGCTSTIVAIDINNHDSVLLGML